MSHYSSQVSTSGYISFGAALNFSSPAQFPSSSLRYIVAPFWTDFDDDTVGGVRCDEYSESEHASGSESILRDVAKFIEKLKPDVVSFNPTWMLVCGWSYTNNNMIINPQLQVYMSCCTI